MDPAELLRQLLEIEDAMERRALLRRHGPLDQKFFEELKGQVRKLVEDTPQKALRLAQVGLEATEFTADPQSKAYAWWAQGNAQLFAGQLYDSITAYSTAISILSQQAQPELIAQLQTNCMLPLMWTGRYAEAQAMGQSAMAALQDQEETPQLANLWLNLGICALRQGKPQSAIGQIERAADVFDRMGDEVQAARCRVTQAVALERLDRFAQAKALLRHALAVFSADSRVPWARAALNLGVLLQRLSRYQEALHWLERSRQAFCQAGIEMDAAVADLYRVQAFLDVNLLPEAVGLGQELIQTFSHLDMPRQVARAASLLGEAYTRQGHVEAALQQLGQARCIFYTQGDPVEVALIDLRRAGLLRRSSRPGTAFRLAESAANVLEIGHYPLRHAEAHLVMADCCRSLGLIEEAQLAYRVAWRSGSQVTETTQPPAALAGQIAYARGTIAEAAGRRALARGEYGRAVQHLDRIGRGIGLDELRGGYLSDKRAVYEAALRLALEDERLDEAFAYAEMARGGALRDILAGELPQGPDRAVPDELAKIKDQWAWRAHLLQRPVDLRAEADQDVVPAEDRSLLLRELARLERRLADLYRRRRLDRFSAALPGKGQIPGLDEVCRYLPQDNALLIFDHIGDQLLVFTITAGDAAVLSLGSLDRLRWNAAALRHALEETRLFDRPADLAMLEADLQQDLQELYRMVLEPALRELGEEIRQLLIVPCDLLHVLPLEACFDGERYLLERYALAFLPMASIVTRKEERANEHGGRPLILAHSTGGRLPLAIQEASWIARTLDGETGRAPLVLVGERATAAALRKATGSANLVHIAAHGIFRDDAPLFSALHLADGPLTVHDIYELDLSRARLVALSGCQTGRVQGRGGEMLGLVQACFSAGAPALLASRWRVEDRATTDLMVAFYEYLQKGRSPAAALREAQLAQKGNTPHPYYWAGFALWGRG